MTWIIHVLFCSLTTGACQFAPVQPERYHYFALERCERELKLFRYLGRIPQGYEIVLTCYDEVWP